MRWFQVTAVVLATAALAGCPSEFGKDGRVGKAVHKDAQERLDRDECSEEFMKEVCGDGPNRDDFLCDQCRE